MIIFIHHRYGSDDKKDNKETLNYRNLTKEKQKVHTLAAVYNIRQF